MCPSSTCLLMLNNIFIIIHEVIVYLFVEEVSHKEKADTDYDQDKAKQYGQGFHYFVLEAEKENILPLESHVECKLLNITLKKQ